ncbi:hypothetical protein OV208_06670 [Corallococcus sp. bb12-1]|uniref:hypothetical protein n=1 Tax=Corallococcus sp. bb12-1 TaxID=2996784 RepID=UPI0022714B5A|nr:hypothetical protein [Corallococcus sp. bb12-1]MCY1040995.1 hypothetical protein [Corallococcus sp. bb12-1]
MSRSDPRHAKPLSSVTDDPSDAAAGRASSALRDLVEEVRSPAVTRSDVYLLIDALDRAPAEEGLHRERADLLLDLMARDNPVGDYTGRNGKTVRHAARDALLALGFPYALEVPPELMEPAAPPRPPRTGIGRGGFAALATLTLYQTGLFSWTVWKDLTVRQSSHLPPPRFTRDTAVMIAVMVAFTWLPPLVSLVGHVWKRRWLQSIGSTLLAVQTMPWLLVAGASVLRENEPIRAVILPWYLSLWALWATRPLPKSPPLALGRHAGG